MTAPSRLPAGLIAMILLVIVQGILGLFRSFNLIHIGTALSGEGLIFIPLMGLITIARGGLVAIVAILYVLFAFGAYTGKSWAWSVGLIAAVINVLFVLAVAAGEDNIVLPLVWGIVPVILLCYLFFPAGRRALTD